MGTYSSATPEYINGQHCLRAAVHNLAHAYYKHTRFNAQNCVLQVSSTAATVRESLQGPAAHCSS
eukprot:18133-Heterococcus_DN1.PRE.2